MSKCIEEKAMQWNECGIESYGKAFGKGLTHWTDLNGLTDGMIAEIHHWKEEGGLGARKLFGNMLPKLDGSAQDVERREIVAALTNHFQEEGRVGTKVLTRPCWPI